MKVTFNAERNGYGASKSFDLSSPPREGELINWTLGHGNAWRVNNVAWTIEADEVTARVELR